MNLSTIFIFICCLFSIQLSAFQIPSRDELLLSFNESLPLWIDRAHLLASTHESEDNTGIIALDQSYHVRCIHEGHNTTCTLEDKNNTPQSTVHFRRSFISGIQVLNEVTLDDTLKLKFSYNAKGQIIRAEKNTKNKQNTTTIQYEKDGLVLTSGKTETHYVFKKEPVDTLLCREKSETGVKRIIILRQPSQETTLLDDGSSLDETSLLDVTKRTYKKSYKDSLGRTIFEEIGSFDLDTGKEVPHSCIALTFTPQGNKTSEHIQDFARGLDITLHYDDVGRVTCYSTNDGKTTISYETIFDDEFQDVLLKTTTILTNGMQCIEWKDKNSISVRVEKRDAFGKLQHRKTTLQDPCNNTITTTAVSYYDNKLSSHYTLQTKKNAMGCIEWSKFVGGDEERITTYCYDTFGKLLSKKKPNGTTLYYEYKDNMLSRIFSGDKTVDYTLDHTDDGRIATINDLIENSTLCRLYDDQGNLIKEIYDGKEIAFTYSNHQKTKTVLHDGSSIEYARDNNRETIVRKDASGNTIYTLRPAYNSETTTEAEIQFSVDGQIESEKGEFTHTFVFNANHELLSKDSFSCERNSFGDVVLDADARYAYDACGNLTEKTSSQGHYQYFYDALDRIIKITLNGNPLYEFRYDLFGRMRKETQYTELGQKTKLLIWNENEEIGSTDVFGTINELKLHFQNIAFSHSIPAGCELYGTLYQATHDKRGSITSLYLNDCNQPFESYTYSAFGTERIYKETKAHGENDVKEPTNPWRYRAKRTHAGLVYFGLRHYMPENQRWMSQDPTSYCDGLNTTCYVHNDPMNNIDTHGLFSIPVTLPPLSFSLWEMLENVLRKSMDTITFAEKSLDLFFDFRSHFEDIAFKMIQKRFLILLGYSPDPTCRGVIGDTTIHPKVRVTSINGILNAFEDAQINSQLISETHGNVPVHYIYSRTHGFTGDLLRALLVKTGFTSPQAEILSETWRELIQEMGGTSGGGKIIHYAHSLGGADTKKALALISPEERNMIDVRTFGSATVISKNDAPVVQNYISSNDGIPLLVDSYNYFLAMNRKHDDVKIIESQLDIPLIDHTLTGNTYRTVIASLGYKFVNTYSHPSLFKQLTLEPKDIEGAEPLIENRPPPFEGAFGVHSPRTPEGIFRDLITNKAFFMLGRVIERQMVEKKFLKLYELEYLQESTGCLPLKYALDAAQAMQKLDPKPSLPLGSLIRLALYIETTFITEKAKGNYLITKDKSSLPRAVEYDQKTKSTFIHIGEDASGYIGRGTHKVVVQSILYDRTAPEILARCIMKQAGNEDEVALLKKFDGLKGLMEVRALILRGRVEGQRQYDIFLKYYNSGTLSKFIGSKEHKKMALKDRIVLAIDLVRGLGNMHSQGYVHRDLHCNNYFLHRQKDSLTGSESLRLVVGDYGQARRIKDCRDMIAQPARFYRSPESIVHGKLRGNHYKKTDVYAIGCVFHSLFYYKRPPWFNDTKYPTGAGSKPTPQLKKIRKMLEWHITRRANTILNPIRKKKSAGESLTTQEKVDCLIFKMMHPDSHRRPSARAIEAKLQKLLKECQN